jgi:hypothetical protein
MVGRIRQWSYSPNVGGDEYCEFRQESTYLAHSGDALRFCGEYAAFLTMTREVRNGFLSHALQLHP